MKIYDADQISIMIAGIPITSGFADGEFITIEPEAEDFTDVVGTDGEVTRSKTNDRRATLTLKLMQTSEANALLSALNETDKNTPGGAGVGALLIRDRQGLSLYQAAECWIQKGPNITFDREATAREWIIRCAKLVPFTGGN
jgi:hypothetical protein